MVVTSSGTRVRVPRAGPARGADRWPVRVAIVLGVLGLGYRAAMLLAGSPATNSDEATMALAALHIAQGRELPVFFYGQYYMGTLEAYLAAPLFVLAGAATLLLRLPLLPLYGLFLVLMWRLARRLYTPWLATFTVGLLALGADRILVNQLVAGGGYPEMNPAGALLLLLAVNLALGVVRHRRLAYAGWGLVAGLMAWDDWLVLPYAAAAGALLLVVPGRRPAPKDLAALAAGAVTGALPLLVHNLTAPFAQNSVAVFLTLNGGSGGSSFGDRFHGAVLYGLPMGTGLCPREGCASWQLWWGWCYPVLLVVAGALAVRALHRARRTGDPGVVVRQAGRLALLAAAALTVLAYLRSGAAAGTPTPSSRYLSCLLISTPAVLWPLWAAAGRRRWSLPARGAAVLPLAALVTTMGLATAAAVVQAPADGRQAVRWRALVAELDRLGVDRFYTEYWTCHVLVFETRERLQCAVVDDDLGPGQDRYPRYRDAVRAAPRPAFVLPGGTPISARVGDRMQAADPGVTRSAAGGYDIYLPTRRLDLPQR